jgi:peptidoglycan/LPS O-acetylase OafA/YrhL
MLLLVFLSSRYWNVPLQVSPTIFAYNLGLINGNFFVPSIDLVNWTLAIEVKFYLLCALMYSSIKSGRITHYIGAAVVILAFCEWQQPLFAHFGLATPSFSYDALKTELMCIIFMLIGTCFYHHYIGNKTTRELVVGAASLFVLFILCWPHTSWLGQIPTVAQNYFYALVLFSLAYGFRRYARPFAPLDFVANISYSIYVLHSIIGYLTIRILMDLKLSFPASLLGTIVFVFALSYALHKLVEMPTMRLGKRVAAAVTLHTPTHSGPRRPGWAGLCSAFSPLCARPPRPSQPALALLAHCDSPTKPAR